MSSISDLFRYSVFEPRALFLIAALLFMLSAFSQKQQLGLLVGLGNSDTDTPIAPFGYDYNNFKRIGLSYTYAPANAPFDINTGLLYGRRGRATSAFDYIFVPLEIEFGFGRRLQGLFGLKVQGGYLLNYGDGISEDIESSLNRFQFAVGWNSGVGVLIKQEVHLDLKYNFDWSTIHAYETSRFSPGGNPYSERKFWFDGFLSMGLSRDL